MPLFKKSNILFIHIPKNAGTSIEKQLYDLEDKLDRYCVESFFTPIPETYYYNRNYSLQHFTMCDFIDILGEPRLNSFKTIFTIVRNPYERMVSEFYYYRYFIMGTSVEYKNLTALQRQFENFCQLVLSGHIINDNHHLPQYLYLIDKSGKIDPRIKILRYEKLAQQIKDLLGLELSHHELKSKRRETYRAHYTESCQQLVANYYEKDFVIFGYDRDILP